MSAVYDTTVTAVQAKRHRPGKLKHAPIAKWTVYANYIPPQTENSPNALMNRLMQKQPEECHAEMRMEPSIAVYKNIRDS